MELLNLKQTASLLGISIASVRNWQRQGIIIQKARGFYGKADVLSVNKKIRAGTISRLGQRANKTRARKSFIPREYLAQAASVQTVAQLVAYIGRHRLDIPAALFLLGVNLFKAAGELKVQTLDDLLNLRKGMAVRRQVFVLLDDWKKKLDPAALNGHDFLLKTALPDEPDLLGVIYQSVLAEGEKAGRGSYYTPGVIVDSLIEKGVAAGTRVLDPCCGTGQFLLAQSRYIQDPQDLTGFDCDEVAVMIATANLLLKFASVDFAPRIYHVDTLEVSADDFLGAFDFIATNPPWGALSTAQPDSSPIHSNESFSRFLIKSLNFLKPGGRLAFVLPESVLNVKTHREIRRFLLENTRLTRIRLLGKKFQGVFSRVITLELQKAPSRANAVLIEANGSQYSVPQEALGAGEELTFNVFFNPAEKSVIEKIMASRHTTLKGQAEWALGIVTGDNNRYVSSALRPGWEMVYRGKDIQPYRMTDSGLYIRFAPEKYQQTAAEAKYRAPQKLIYRFINKNLVFAYDDKQSLTLNSANILIPRGYPLKIILALFNSRLYSFLFQKKFNSLKILRSHLEELPLPLPVDSGLTQLTVIADEIIAGRSPLSEVDSLLYELFGLSAKEKAIIEKK